MEASSLTAHEVFLPSKLQGLQVVSSKVLWILSLKRCVRASHTAFLQSCRCLKIPRSSIPPKRSSRPYTKSSGRIRDFVLPMQKASSWLVGLARPPTPPHSPLPSTSTILPPLSPFGISSSTGLPELPDTDPNGNPRGKLGYSDSTLEPMTGASSSTRMSSRTRPLSSPSEQGRNSCSSSKPELRTSQGTSSVWLVWLGWRLDLTWLICLQVTWLTWLLGTKA